MFRIIFIISVIILLSLPTQALNSGGTPIQFVVTQVGYSGYPTILSYLDFAVLESSTYCKFVGQPARIRIVIVADYDCYEHVNNYTIEWYARFDSRSTKFEFLDKGEGSWKLGEERQTAISILDHTDELIEPYVNAGPIFL